MLAEKVESQAEYEEARSLGYAYFQGYFFARPQVISASEVPSTKVNQLRVLRELRHAELDFKCLEQLVRRDLSLAPKLLRYVNSAAFALNERIGSIMQALVILGEQNSRKLIALAIMADWSRTIRRNWSGPLSRGPAFARASPDAAESRVANRTVS